MNKLPFFLFVFLISAAEVLAQTSEICYNRQGLVTSVKYSRQADKTEVPRSTDAFFKSVLNKKSGDAFVKNSKVRLTQGHETYEQMYKGVKVDGAGYTFHFDEDGFLSYAHGNYVDTDGLDVIPFISAEDAIVFFAKFRNVDIRQVPVSDAELMVKAINAGEKAKLVYKVFLSHPDCDVYGIVDAHTGEVLSTEPLLMCINAVGTFETRYNGTKSSNTDYTGSYYRLKDTSRGAVIETQDLENADVSGALSPVEICDENNSWHRSEMPDSLYMALDVHWALQQIYDWLYNNYSINSLDNQGKAINAYVRAKIDGDSLDAAWFGRTKSFYFGKGGEGSGTRSTVDIVAHEYGHGISFYQIGWSVDSVMQLSEGLSDIWAVIMEHHIGPAGASIWQIGESACLSWPTCLRDIANPNNFGAGIQIAKTYGDQRYMSTTNNYVKSGVFSRWFYYLVNGGSGFNSKGDYFNIAGVGMDVAEKLIVKAVFSNYLRNQNTYQDVRMAFIEAANALCVEDLAVKVANAWYAVGVGDCVCEITGPSSPCSTSVYAVENLSYNYTVEWSFMAHPTTGSYSLVPNYPSLSQCTFNNSNHDYVEGNLLATIYDGNGNLVNTLTKHLDTAKDFWATYTQTDLLHNEITGWIDALGTVRGKKGSPIVITSSDFIGASFSFSTTLVPQLPPIIGDSLVILEAIPATTMLNYVETPAPNPAYTHTGNTLSVTYSLAGLSTKSVVDCFNGKRAIRFNIYAKTLFEDVPLPEFAELTVSRVNGNYMKVQLALSSKVQQLVGVADSVIPSEWEVEVFNAQTGKQMISKHVVNGEVLINSVMWKPGVYIVRAKTDSGMLMQKVNL